MEALVRKQNGIDEDDNREAEEKREYERVIYVNDDITIFDGQEMRSPFGRKRKYRINITPARAGRKAKAPTLVMLMFETKHFQFITFGKTRQHAAKALVLAWTEHCRQYPDADPDLLVKNVEDMNFLNATAGAAFRDKEELLTRV